MASRPRVHDERAEHARVVRSAKVIRLCLRRPVAVAMAYGAVALLGVAAWRNVPIEVLPDTDLPQLSVRATWGGASPETVEAFLTAPLESAIQQVRGVERIVSTSSEEQGIGTAEIQVEFARDVDMDFARLDLSERLASLEESLPPSADPVQVEQYVPSEFEEQSRPFLQYTFTGPYAMEALRQHLDDVVAPELTQVDGVATVRVFGGRERRLEIALDEEAVAALGLGTAEVRRAILDLDLVRQAGVVRDDGLERTLTIANRPESAEDVRSAILTVAGVSPVRLGEVARVVDTYEEARSFSRIRGRPAVGFRVVKSIGVNTVRVADAVKARLAELERLAPFGAEYHLEWDESEDIRRQLSDLRVRAAVSAVVIFLVLLGFLRSFRSTAVVFATIAFSVLIALNLIYFGGLTLNLLTLMGLAMGFGLVVDNAIVVLENVYRKRQQGAAAFEAAEGGSSEVVLPILASTATTLIVFVPFVYLQGELRVFYVPLGIVVALTLLASLFVAFTFIPSMALRVLGPGRESSGTKGSSGTGGASEDDAARPFYQRFYADVVGFTVRHPWVSVTLTAAAFLGSYSLFDRYVSRWAVWGGGWGSDTYIQVFIDLPRGSNLDRADQLVRFFEERVDRMPEVESYAAQVTPTRGAMEITFPDSLENTAVPVVIKEQMVAFSHTFTGADVRVYGFGPSFYGGGGSPPNYGIQVLGYNFERVRDIAEDIGARLQRLSRVVDVDTNASSNRFQRDRASEFVLEIDRGRMALHDLAVEDVVEGIATAAAGRSRVSYLKLGGDEVQIEVKLDGSRDLDVLALRETLIPTPGGQRIRLGDIVRVAQREVLAVIRRENQQYERTVAYEFRGPSRLGDGVHEAVIAGVDVPPGYTVQTGRRNWFVSQEDQQQIWMVLGIALLLVYMVTAALFESLVRPLAVIGTVPMAMIGVYLVFFYTGASFTREAYIGVIMMLGIVVNNAILLVDHVNRIRSNDPGTGLDQAIVRGTVERVRPILMTTITTVAGLLPLVLFGDAAGSNIWDALALVLIGGLLSSTLFVLTITPAVYGVLERWAGRGDLRSVPVGTTGMNTLEPAGHTTLGWVLFAAIATGSAIPAETHAQIGGGPGFAFREPWVSVTVHGGYARADADSDLFDFTRDNLFIERDDFDAPYLGIEAAFKVADRWDVAVEVGHQWRETRTEFRDYVEEGSGAPIVQDVEFRQTPVVFGAKYYLTDRGRGIGRFVWIPSRVTPFLGGGIGFVRYEFAQDGDFVDFQTLDVFTDRIEQRGTAFTAQGTAGVDIQLARQIFLSGQARYAWAEDDLDRTAFDGFEPIDLSGFRFTLGVGFRM